MGSPPNHIVYKSWDFALITPTKSQKTTTMSGYKIHTEKDQCGHEWQEMYGFSVCVCWMIVVSREQDQKCNETPDNRAS